MSLVIKVQTRIMYSLDMSKYSIKMHKVFRELSEKNIAYYEMNSSIFKNL